MREYKNVKQEAGPVRRRWFESDGLDLVVWFGAGDEVVGFQLCYDLGAGPHSLTWRNESGFAHHAIDPGDRSSFSKLTPVLVAAGAAPWMSIVRLFDTRSDSLDPALRQLVRDQLATQTAAAHP